MGKHTITLPDGTTARRNSKTMTYTQGVLVTTDNRAWAAAKRADAVAHRALHAEAQRILDEGDLTVLERQHSATNGRGERFYRSVVPGNHPYHWLPDHKDLDAWHRYLDGAVRSIAEQAVTLDREADELDAGPEFSYGIHRWSQSAANAAKGADEIRRQVGAVCTVRVVTVD